MTDLVYSVHCGDCLDVLPTLPRVDCIFADPPDNLGLDYGAYQDRLTPPAYLKRLEAWLRCFVARAGVVWMSYNARWTLDVGRIVCELLDQRPDLEAKPCVQTFTFGQHNQRDLANCHRPLLRLKWTSARLYPDAIRVPSWRQENGDKRADPRGRIPGDVFDFPRVTGNSRQRRTWHPTQLHERLVERCVLLNTPPGGLVADPFGGSGTTLRVCRRLGRSCHLIEIDPDYCQRIHEENH